MIAALRLWEPYGLAGSRRAGRQENRNGSPISGGAPDSVEVRGAGVRRGRGRLARPPCSTRCRLASQPTVAEIGVSPEYPGVRSRPTPGRPRFGGMNEVGFTPSAKRRRGRGSPAIQARFSRLRGTVQQSPVKRQETQIVRSDKTLDDFLPRFRPEAIRRYVRVFPRCGRIPVADAIHESMQRVDIRSPPARNRRPHFDRCLEPASRPRQQVDQEVSRRPEPE